MERPRDTRQELILWALEHRVSLLRWLHRSCTRPCVDGEHADHLVKLIRRDVALLDSYVTLFQVQESEEWLNSISRIALWTTCVMEPRFAEWVKAGETLLATWRAWPAVDAVLLHQRP